MAVAPPQQEVDMGSLYTTLTVTNNLDQARAEGGELDAVAVRSVILPDVLVDTGATYLGLPPDVVAGLGLRSRGERSIRTANGVIRARLFRDAELTVLDRSTTLDVLELPAGTPALLGMIPMQTLGIEADARNRTLRLLPMAPDDTYITVL